MLNKYKERIYLAVRVILIVAMCATLLFIFINSALPKEQSAAQSGVIEEIVDKIIPDEVPVKNLIIENIRKIAHFSEYGLLGIEVILYIFLFLRKRIYLYAPLSPLCAAFVGFIDESIQMLSNRGPMISDVWIDIGGFVTFALLSLGVLYAALGVIKLYGRHRGAKHNGEGESEQSSEEGELTSG